MSAKLFLNVLLTGYAFLLKPLTKSESHGQISDYEVILWSPEENSQQTLTLPQSVYSLPINVTDRGSKVTVTVTARNPAGVSPPANIVIPRHLPGKNGGGNGSSSPDTYQVRMWEKGGRIQRLRIGLRIYDQFGF